MDIEDGLQKLELDMSKVAVKGFTIGPTAPPLQFDPLTFIDHIISLKHQAMEQGWIFDKPKHKDHKKHKKDHKHDDDDHGKHKGKKKHDSHILWSLTVTLPFTYLYRLRGSNYAGFKRCIKGKNA